MDRLPTEQWALVEAVKVTKDRIKVTMQSGIGALAQLRDMHGFKAPAKIRTQRSGRHRPGHLQISLA
jgi:hypothetical protein